MEAMYMLSSVLAQSPINIQPGGQFSGLNSITFANIVAAVIQLILIVVSIILLFILIGGGIAMMTSGGGNPQNAERGRQAVTGAIIGLIIVFGAWAILNLINIFFGVNILQLNIPNAQAP